MIVSSAWYAYNSITRNVPNPTFDIPKFEVKNDNDNYDNDENDDEKNRKLPNLRWYMLN